MIKIEKNTVNQIALTLNESSSLYATGSTPYFLFEFINSQSNVSKYLIPVYVSANTRYNLFQITEDSTEDLTGGTVSLTTGYYQYKIHEQSNQYNTDVNNTIQIIEYGKVLVSLSSGNTVTYTGNSSNTNYIYYSS